MKEDRPITGGLAFGLIAFGVFIDLLQAILDFLLIGLVLNYVLDFIAIVGFWIMLHHHGGGVLKRRSISLGATLLIELIPVINAMPTWTLYAIRTIVAERTRHGMHGEDQFPKMQQRKWRI